MGVFNKTIIPLALVGYEAIIANLAIYHLISNAPSWKNCYFNLQTFNCLYLCILLYFCIILFVVKHHEQIVIIINGTM